MRYSTLVAPIFLLAVPATAAAAGCEPVFVNGDQAVVINNVEIEPGGRSTQDFQIRVRNAGGSDGGPTANVPDLSEGGTERCSAAIRIARVGVIADPGLPPYILNAPGNRQIEILPDPAAGGTADSDVIVANTPSDSRGRTVPFQIGVTTEWGLRAGSYIEQLQLSLIDPNGSITDSTTLTITIVIPAAVSLRLVGAVVGGGDSGPAQIDLGTLSSSADTRSQRFGARILSTAPYAVRFSSLNLGNLMHERGDEQVPYRLFFDGALVDLAGTNEFHYPNHTPREGDSRPMSIVVPAVVALAGRYSDRITMTVTAM